MTATAHLFSPRGAPVVSLNGARLLREASANRICEASGWDQRTCEAVILGNASWTYTVVSAGEDA